MALVDLTEGLKEAELTLSPRAEQSLVKALHGNWYRIVSLKGPEEGCYRLLELGFTPGTEVKVTQTAPLGEPLIVVLRGTRIALRKDEASWIIVE